MCYNIIVKTILFSPTPLMSHKKMERIRTKSPPPFAFRLWWRGLCRGNDPIALGLHTPPSLSMSAWADFVFYEGTPLLVIYIPFAPFVGVIMLAFPVSPSLAITSLISNEFISVVFSHRTLLIEYPSPPSQK